MKEDKKIMVSIDISKATSNAYKRQEAFKSYDNAIREVLIRVNPQTMIDRTIKDYSTK